MKTVYYSFLVVLRHGLEDWFDSVSECEFVDDVLFRLVEVDFPRVFTAGFGKFYVALVLVTEVVEQVLVKTRVLDVVRRNLSIKGKWSEPVGLVDS